MGTLFQMLWTIQTEAMDPSCKSLHNLKKKKKKGEIDLEKDIRSLLQIGTHLFLTTEDSEKKDVLGSREKPAARNEKSLNNAWEMGLSRLFDLPRINETLFQNALPGYTSS